MTNVFNVFVYLQVFNMVNARKIHDEKNIFEGITSNKLFLIMWFFICFFQIIVIEFLEVIMECARGGLPW